MEVKTRRIVLSSLLFVSSGMLIGSGIVKGLATSIISGIAGIVIASVVIKNA